MSTQVLLRQHDAPVPGTAPATLRVGLLGCGVVGSAVARLLVEGADDVAAAAGARLELTRVAVRHLEKHRPVDLPRGSLSPDAFAVVDDPSIDVVVEVVGGIDLPRELVTRALRNGKSVVTANKELLAVHGRELSLAGRDGDVDLLFEGAAGGAIPIVATLRDRLAAAEKSRLIGVVNGTTNYVLELMAEAGLSQEDAVAEARRLGYAEADPASDLDGSDAAAKIAILASLAFGSWVTVDSVERRGITGIAAEDVLCARALGYDVKLVALAQRAEAGVILQVGPALVPLTSSLGALRGVTNELTVECAGAGPLTFRGAGAGGDATATAVVGDVVTAARNLLAGTRCSVVDRPSPLRPVAQEAARRHFFRVRTRDADGVTVSLAAGGIAAEPGSAVAAGDEPFTGLVLGPVPAAVAHEARDRLIDLGFGPGPLLPLVEVR